MTPAWPTGTEYSEAVQNPDVAFLPEDLKHAHFETAMLGLPAAATGQNAIVFRAGIDDRPFAIRCFTTPAAEGQRRYEALHEHVSAVGAQALAQAWWTSDGIRVRERVWPVVRMEWVDGAPLHRWVETRLGEDQALRRMADDWHRLAVELRQARIAHGDLQHGNVLVEPDDRLRLIDFDGVWVPGLEPYPPSEIGHPNYQHPERVRTGHWDHAVDTFSALVVYLSLRALAQDTSLWEHHTGENLIFTAGDFKAPRRTPLWSRLGAVPDSDVSDLTDLLAAACELTVAVDHSLDDVLTRRVLPDTAVSSVPPQSPPPTTAPGEVGRWWADPHAVPTADAGPATKTAITAFTPPATPPPTPPPRPPQAPPPSAPPPTETIARSPARPGSSYWDDPDQWENARLDGTGSEHAPTGTDAWSAWPLVVIAAVLLVLIIVAIVNGG